MSQRGYAADETGREKGDPSPSEIQKLAEGLRAKRGALKQKPARSSKPPAVIGVVKVPPISFLSPDEARKALMALSGVAVKGMCVTADPREPARAEHRASITFANGLTLHGITLSMVGRLGE